MNCKQCSKVIPDGFTDCPWCGAPFGSSAPGPKPPSGSVDTGSSAHQLLIALSLVSSGLLFCVLNYFAMVRSEGELTAANFGYFLLRFVGAIAVAAAVVVLFCKIRDLNPRRPVLSLVILTLSSLVTLATMMFSSQPRLKGIDKATVRRYSNEGNRPSPANVPALPPTKWDSATRSLLKDVQARNEQYVAAISGLDETAKPLYTPESFRDAATIQTMLDQLHTRLAVADEYSDWQPVFARMKDYVAAVDASDAEKQKFLAAYHAALPSTLAACKAISAQEHAWLQATMDLYQFALAKQGAYTWHGDQLAFKSHADSIIFRQKFIKARTLNTQFLQAYWQVRQAEEAMLAQMGLQAPAVDTAPEQ
ncbi:MAG TPA: hypothetical protein VMH20_19700 [Verrucomicrobiae bacterium]|nr:hypothetical protein [Verrucomicrobiae bacterium]